MSQARVIADHDDPRHSSAGVGAMDACASHSFSEASLPPPGAPILTVQSAAELIGRSGQATNQAITRLAEAKVLSQTTVGKRNRAFEASEMIRAFTALERPLASPSGDTRTAPPARKVPRRN